MKKIWLKWNTSETIHPCCLLYNYCYILVKFVPFSPEIRLWQMTVPYLYIVLVGWLRADKIHRLVGIFSWCLTGCQSIYKFLRLVIVGLVITNSPFLCTLTAGWRILLITPYLCLLLYLNGMLVLRALCIESTTVHSESRCVGRSSTFEVRSCYNF